MARTRTKGQCNRRLSLARRPTGAPHLRLLRGICDAAKLPLHCSRLLLQYLLSTSATRSCPFRCAGTATSSSRAWQQP
jgi:hypothetical protein